MVEQHVSSCPGLRQSIKLVTFYTGNPWMVIPPGGGGCHLAKSASVSRWLAFRGVCFMVCSTSHCVRMDRVSTQRSPAPAAVRAPDWKHGASSVRHPPRIHCHLVHVDIQELRGGQRDLMNQDA